MTQEHIKKLQVIEQNLQGILMHKQQVQTQLIELDSALEELTKAKTAYKIIGNIMVNTIPEELTKDLENKKEVITLRISTFEKQEEKLRKDAKELQEKIVATMKK
jgi:prefoldin beta subunit